MDRIMKIDEVVEVVQCCKSVVFEEVKKGRFPPPVRLAAKRIGWRQSDVEKWIAGLETVQQKGEKSEAKKG